MDSHATSSLSVYICLPKIKSTEIREHTFVYFFVSFVPDWSKGIEGGWKVHIKIEVEGLKSFREYKKGFIKNSNAVFSTYQISPLTKYQHSKLFVK